MQRSAIIWARDYARELCGAPFGAELAGRLPRTVSRVFVDAENDCLFELSDFATNNQRVSLDGTPRTATGRRI